MSTIEFSDRIYQLSKMLHAFAYNLTKNTEDAKDLFQETAFRAMTLNTLHLSMMMTVTDLANVFVNTVNRSTLLL